jgi:hypothetical protein
MNADAELFELDPATCRTLLRTQQVGRIATGGSEPRVVPVNYVLVDDVVVFNTDETAAVTTRIGERVAFEVDMIDHRTRSGWSVVVHGRLHVPSTDPFTPPPPRWAPGARTRTLGITVEVLTGRLLRGAVGSPLDPPAGYL